MPSKLLPNLGLSPLARRNLVACAFGFTTTGTISARAEEPFHCFRGQIGGRDYLRSRGGTSRRRFRLSSSLGLSPLARRNPVFQLVGAVDEGTISARAEEPGTLAGRIQC